MVCPECGMPAGPQGAGCACGGARGTGAGQAAFEPLRIRPYVNLQPPSGPAADGAEPHGTAPVAPDGYGQGPAPQAPPAATGVPLPPEAPPAQGTPPASAARQGAGQPEPDVETTAPLYLGAALPGGAPGGAGSAEGAGAAPAAYAPYDAHAAYPPEAPHQAPGPYGAHAPHGHPAPDAPYGGGTGGEYGVDVTPGPRRSRRQQGGRKRPGAVIAAVAAVVAVAGTAAFASGLFDGEETSDRVAPEPNLSAPPWPSVDASASTSPSVDASPEESAPPSDAETSPSAPATPSTSAEPVPVEAPEVRETASARPRSQAPSPTRETGQVSGSTLSRGDRGEEVLELQKRLREIGVYDNAMNSRYDKNVERAVAEYQERRGITGDAPGVYGPATRAALEGETSGG
ncbi:peptidoglycan-binding protein [Streptomyces sp. SudanB25_2051]|uniref:peptidoglycan-binding domain-containing protein n=1 Tax=Streptomyces sp. SudanB25_2051 TaxID=3035275 RepID=UPI003F55057C